MTRQSLARLAILGPILGADGRRVQQSVVRLRQSRDKVVVKIAEDSTGHRREDLFPAWSRRRTARVAEFASCVHVDSWFRCCRRSKNRVIAGDVAILKSALRTVPQTSRTLHRYAPVLTRSRGPLSALSPCELVERRCLFLVLFALQQTPHF
jgi:hypothetical protein